MFDPKGWKPSANWRAAVAHGVSTASSPPLIGQSELILNDLPLNSRLSKNVNEIHRAANRAAVLTRQLLAYGRKQLLQPELLI